MNITARDISDIFDNFLETVILLAIVLLFVIIIGTVLGVSLYITSNDNIIRRNKFLIVLNKVLSVITDIFRSLPFLVLMIVLIPVSIYLTGEMIGIKGALPPLILSASPFFARIVSNSLRDVPYGVIEASKSMGASPLKTITILIREALPSLISGLTVTMITLLGFIASAGVIGAGGLGQYAIKNAEIFKYDLTIIAVIIILLMVFIIQFTGDFIAKKIDRR